MERCDWSAWFLVCLSLWQLGGAVYNCRRSGMTCANNGNCDSKGKCACVAGYKGFDCALQDSSIVTEGCKVTCDNGGTCFGAAKDKCYCAENFYGDTCKYKRASVECLHDRMEINIFPHGDFQGRIFILGQNRTSCNLTLISQQGNVTYKRSAWKGYGIRVNHNDDNCSNATVTEKDRTRTYSREVVLEYSTKYVTSLDEVVTLTCMEVGRTGEDGVIFTSSTRTVQLNESSMYEKSKVENAYEPLTFTVKDKDNQTVTSNSEPLAVGDDVTLDFELSSTDKYQKLYVINCTIMDSDQNPQASLSLIHDGCPTSSARAVFRSMTRSKNDSSLQVTMAVFKFSSGNSLVVACFLKLCQQGDSRCDAKACGGSGVQGVGRRRRDAQEHSEMRLTTTLTVRVPPGGSQACQGGCLNEGLCVSLWGQDRCFCTNNFYGPTCALSQGEDTCSGPENFIIVVAVMASLLLLLLTLSVALMIRNLRHKHRTVEFSQPFGQPKPEPVRFTLPRIQCAHL